MLFLMELVHRACTADEYRVKEDGCRYFPRLLLRVQLSFCCFFFQACGAWRIIAWLATQPHEFLICLSLLMRAMSFLIHVHRPSVPGRAQNTWEGAALGGSHPSPPAPSGQTARSVAPLRPEGQRPRSPATPWPPHLAFCHPRKALPI